MRVKVGPFLVILLLSAAPATAKLVEFNEGHHAGNSQITGRFAGSELEMDGSVHPFNFIEVHTPELVVREAKTDYYIDMENGPSHSRVSEHSETTLHNVVLEAIARDTTMYAAFHPIGGASVEYQGDAMASGPTKGDSHTDVNWIQLDEPRTSDVSETLDVASQGHVDAEIIGGVSVNLWGWNVRITSNEGVFEYQTGPSRETEAGPTSVGPATQLQVESSNATVTFSGTFDAVHHVWIRDAVAVSDRMDLKLTNEDLPTDNVVFDERSQLTVLGVSDFVTANVTQVIPFIPVSPSEPATDPGPAPQDSDGEAILPSTTPGDSGTESLAPEIVVKVPWIVTAAVVLVLALTVLVAWFLVHPLRLYEHLHHAGGSNVSRITPVTDAERRAIAWSWKSRQHAAKHPRLAAMEAGIAARLDPSRPVYRLRQAHIHASLGHHRRVLQITKNLWMLLTPRRSKAEVHCLRAQARLALGHAEIAHREMRAADSLDAFTTHDALEKWRKDHRFRRHDWIGSMYDELHRLIHHTPYGV